MAVRPEIRFFLAWCASTWTYAAYFAPLATGSVRPQTALRHTDANRRQLQRIQYRRQHMTRPPRLPDLLVNFALTALRNDGLSKRVMSGYRPIYKVRSDYWSSAHHEFVDGNGVETGGNCQAEVWLLTPQAYPQAFWVGRRVEVAEGTRIVGLVEVLQILNPTLKLSSRLVKYLM
jgi:hypothetical protein